MPVNDQMVKWLDQSRLAIENHANDSEGATNGRRFEANQKGN